jgi:hypothetical protein
MPVSKLTCPECGRVLKPAKPLAVGKKVKCPRCETIFVAVEDEEEEFEERPARAREQGRARGKGGAGKPPAPKAAKKKPEAKKSAAEEIGTYGTIQENEDPEDRPEILFMPEVKIKDLRGPAQAMVMGPSNLMLIVGIIAVVGWLVLILMLVIPVVFPVTEQDKDKDEWVGGPRPREGPKVKKKDPSFYEIWGVDAAFFTKKPWYIFLVSLVPLVLAGIYSGIATFGAVQMQNLESRRWGIAGAIMAMIPLHMGGVIILVGLLTNFLFRHQLEMDAEYTTFLVILFTSIAWLTSLAAGLRCLLVLNDEDVIAGYEYVAE